MAGERFSASVTAWARKTEEQQAAVLHQSLRLLAEEAADNTPEVTGNLKNSRAVSTLGPPTIDWKRKKFSDPSDAINNAIAGVEVGRTAWLGYRAPYAHKIEAKHGFLRLAAQRWRQLVDEAVRIVKGHG
jgi:hypothetical protein